MHRIKLVIVIFFSVQIFECFIASIYCTDGEPPIDVLMRKPHSKYNDKARAKIMRIYFETNTGDWGHERRMKERWDELHGIEMPQTGHNLYKQATKWIKKGYAEKLLTEQERQGAKQFISLKKMKWTPEMEENLLKFYFASKPERWKHSIRMKQLWDTHYSDYRQATAHNLLMKARRLLKDRGEDPSMQELNLTENQKMDLLSSHVESLKYRDGKAEKMREFFIKKYPQYAHVNAERLYLKIAHIQRNKSEICDKILGRVSGLDTIHHPREPGESSRSKRGESTSFPIPQPGIFPGASEIGETSSLGYHVLPDMDMSHQFFYPGVDPSHQNILGYPGDYYYFPEVETSQQTIYPNNTWEQYVTPHVGTSYQAIHSEQRHSTEKQSESSKGKEPFLD